MAVDHPWVRERGLSGDVQIVASGLKAMLFVEFQYSVEMPYMLYSARDREQAAACLAAHDRMLAQGGTPHRVSTLFCGESGLYRPDMVAPARGDGVSQLLSIALQPLEWSIIDEAAIEGEHRSLRVEGQRAHNVTHPFVVATLRMGQSVALVDSARASSVHAAVFARCWRRWKTAAAPPAAASETQAMRATRSMRPSAAVAIVYRLDESAMQPTAHCSPFFGEREVADRAPLNDFKRIRIDYINELVVEGAIYTRPIADATERSG
jgi:hypothetical protein